MTRRMLATLTMLAVLAAAALPALAASPCKDWPAKLRMGVIPTEGSADTAKRFMPLTDHLKKTLGVEIEVFTASDYAGIITAMANKHIEFAYFGPKSYVEASEKAAAEAVAMEISMDGEPGYYGIIITPKNSGITTMDQAKGKTFAFTDPNSTSGFLVPNVLFARDMKVKPQEYFSQVKFSGSHGASILAVKNGDIQVAATNTEDMSRMEEKGSASMKDFNVIWKSELIPGSPYAVRADMPVSLKAAFTGALMLYNNDKAGMQKLQIGGFLPANDASYDIIRYLNKLKKELAKQ